MNEQYAFGLKVELRFQALSAGSCSLPQVERFHIEGLRARYPHEILSLLLSLCDV